MMYHGSGNICCFYFQNGNLTSGGLNIMLFILIPLILLILIAAFFAVLLIRAARFTPRSAAPAEAEDVPIDGEKAVEHLREMLRCRTVSAPEERDEGEFIRFRTMLPQFYPHVFASCKAERVDGTGMILRWKGESSEEPAVFLSHYDVVPADESRWEKPPFGGVLEDGVLWGRGALDMKNQLCGVLEAMEHLISEGFTPRHDVYLCLSGEEEIMGPTAEHIRDLFRERGICPAFVIDEGGDVMEGMFPGTDVPAAMIGVNEKGVANLRFTAKSAGGHASIPTKDNPLPRLCRAMTRIEALRFPRRRSPALEGLVEVMGRYCSFRTRLLLANRDLLRPLYRRWLDRQGGILAASSRTTFALTRAQGSPMGNVIPSQAEMFANMRLLYGDTVDGIVSRLTTVTDREGVEIEKRVCCDPRPDSLCTKGWEELCSAIRATWPEAAVTPCLMVATTESRHWRDICPNVYRFSARAVTREEKACVHGDNERIRAENTRKTAQCFARIMLQW